MKQNHDLFFQLIDEKNVHVNYTTPKITCQYRILDLLDRTMDPLTTQNDINTPYDVIVPMTTRSQLDAGETRADYVAELWLEESVDFYFEIQFSAGSHMNVTWVIEGQAGEDCEATFPGITPIAAHEDATLPLPIEGAGPAGSVACVFPFR